MSNTAARTALAAMAFVAQTVVSPAVAQPIEARAAFTTALGAFSLALSGEAGDEGPGLRSALDQMRRAVSAWDAGIQTYEKAMAAERQGAAPEMAARLHLALGAIYLDRGRVPDGIRELEAAATLHPARPEIQTLLALAGSQLVRASSVDAFRAAAALAPGDGIRTYQYARSLAAAGRAAEAVKEFERFLQIPDPPSPIADPASPFLAISLVQDVPGLEPFFPPALYAKGFALLASGDYAGAVGDWTAALERDPLAAAPGVDTGAIFRAAAALREGGVETAIQQLMIAISLEPDHAEPHRLLGQAYVLDDQYDHAVAELTRAVELDPGDERARLALAAALLDSDQLVATARSLTTTVEAIPASGRAQYDLARLHQREGRYAEALAAFDRALGFNPLLGANSVHQTIGVLRRSQQDFDGAAAAFSTRVDMVPNDPGAHRQLGDIYLRQGRHTEALAEFSLVLRLDPGSAEAHAAIAQIHLRESRYAEAAAAATRVLGLDPEHREARYTLATALIRLGKADEGRRELEIFQRQQAADAAARTRLFELEGLKREAAVTAAGGDHEAAIALLRRVVDADPTMPGALLDLGFALVDAGRQREALPLFEKAVELGAHYEVHRHLAAAHAVLGQGEDSRRERVLYAQLKREALRRAGPER